jgi:hypothetical protein
LIAARTPSAPYLRTSSARRSAPFCTAEIIAAMSPAKLGSRLLRASSASTSSRRRPPSTSFSTGMMSPSAWSSRTSTEKPPGSLPPVSPWCACSAWITTTSPRSS